MKILWFTWKDLTHPLAGGAEVVNEEIAKRLVDDGHEVIFLVGGYKGCKQKEVINGYQIVRLGNRYTSYYHAYKYYKSELSGWADLVVEEVNTIPYFTQFYTSEKRILVIYQLAREVWFYQMKLPFSIIGYLLEPFYIRVVNNNRVLTISNSTKNDLIKNGFKPENIGIISMGTDIQPIVTLDGIEKFHTPTMVSLGRIEAMKRTLDQIKAFEIAKDEIPNLKLKIAGFGNSIYFHDLMIYIAKSAYKSDIEYLGKVSKEEKTELMRKSHIITVTSIKEGWGLIVTEAASQGTPAIVYDVDGLRDSVRDNDTGLICSQNSPNVLASNIVRLVKDDSLYQKLQKNGWEWSKQITFEQCYLDFKQGLTNDI